MNTARWRHPVFREWLWLVLVLVGLTAWCSASKLFWRADLTLYDAALPSAPAPGDVVIVAVDDASVAELGRWPWPRALHAALLDRLGTLQVRAVALDFLLTEPDATAPQSDEALARAMRRGPPTVLPLLLETAPGNKGLRELLPIPVLADAAAQLGHAHLELDRDGVARSVFLREGLGIPHRSHLALALLQSVPGQRLSSLPGLRHPDLAGAPPDVWVRDYQMLIPYLGPVGTFTRLSYADVLRGRVDPAALRGKWVLVGATAQGIGDAYPTPRSGQGRDMPGVEVTANVLQALRSGGQIRPLPLGLTVALCLIPVLAAAYGCLLLPPRQSLLLAAALFLGTLGVSVCALRVAGWWWPPSATLAALPVLYPLWSWRRLQSTQNFMDEEFSRLAGERFPLMSQLNLPPTQARPIEFVQRRIELLRDATARLRSVRQLFSDTLDALPSATLLADADGRIALANPAAAALFGVADAGALEESTVDAQLYRRVPQDAVRFATLAANAPCTVEVVFREQGRDVLIRAVPFRDGRQQRAGTIIDLVDISELRMAQRERNDALRFLSHDMRSPASSLMGLAQLQRDPLRALPPVELSERLDLVAMRLLTLVDGFVALSRAESADPGAFDEFDLRDAVQDAYDEVWAAAQVRANEIVLTVTDESLPVQGDRHLVARTIVNLLSNALKFSPVGAPVELRCQREGHSAAVQVLDQGPGIEPERLPTLFRRFSRGAHRGDIDPGGAGLGLAFVRVVAEKHGGSASAANAPPRGAAFSLLLPARHNAGSPSDAS